jgi:phenylalanyl-tRNA synthetase beta chain
LESLGFEISISGSTLLAKNPSWRHDISIKEDLIEEIVRIHGFGKIPSVPMQDQVRFRLAPNLTNMGNIARRVMAGSGFDEVITFSFMNAKFASNFSKLKDNLHLQNPISSELDYMRPSILPNLMEAIAKNQARSVKDMSFFEVGPVFRGTKSDEEDMYVSAVMSGNIGSELHKSNRATDIYDIKNVLSNLLLELGSSIDNMQLKTDNLPEYMHPGRSAGLYLGKNLLGYFGEIHPRIQKLADVDGRVIFFDLNLSKLPIPRQKFGKRGEYKPSSYQANIRDFAFLFDRTQAIGEITKYIKSLDKNLIQSSEIFDIYEGDKVDPDKKSVAIRIVIQASDHTLSEEELSNLHKQIINNVESKYSAKIRD